MLACLTLLAVASGASVSLASVHEAGRDIAIATSLAGGESDRGDVVSHPRHSGCISHSPIETLNCSAALVAPSARPSPTFIVNDETLDSLSARPPFHPPRH